jgi:hypothetical protein
MVLALQGMSNQSDIKLKKNNCIGAKTPEKLMQLKTCEMQYKCMPSQD